jgi:hypothetical protein
MTTSQAIFTFDLFLLVAGMLSWPLLVKPGLKWLFQLRSSKRPINEFLGKLLPHPFDERWRLDLRHGVENGVVHVDWTPIGSIKIADNQLMLSPRDMERAKEYGLAIYLNLKKLAAEEKHAKALEVLEQRQDEIS